MNIYISTFPRSGSSFLEDYLNTCTDIRATKNHKFVYDNELSDTKTLMIVRKPFDSIASVVAMEKIDNTDEMIEELITKSIIRYPVFYYLVDNYDIVISYEDLVDNIEDVVDRICKIVGGTRNGNPYISSLKDRESLTRGTGQHPSAYVVSSKGLEDYDEVVKTLSLYDLSDCDSAYAKAHAKTKQSF